MFVKICGITREDDALLAVAMGADAVGFIFAPSKRQIAPGVARDIARRLPPEILTVGVFRDQAPARVVDIVNAAGLRAAQLSGRESAEDSRWIKARIPFLINAFAAGDAALGRLDDFDGDAVMLDAPNPGSGQVFDWALAGAVPPGQRLILAGGLTPANVTGAIEAVRPWGVDVATGVESDHGEPGQKDARKVMAFVEAAKATDPDCDDVWDPFIGVADPDDQELDHLDTATLDEPGNATGEPPRLYDWMQDDAR